ncbi:similar to Saccharomyces cerevisiae YDR517W GRH1 Acetylated, cis-golgi localized protein involved in ER to Golgi transport [Maudiozyma saulgeensis]|uniref:Similar to Saccharomyces cerevisiae YDR517W GRH1 Acetylated, cis-golgi localized protein involved in ER to Golgi transport n=1 Tax=Maudiozyma saulgeensis TaxID=1789683 RepID=A0A1X7R7F8_9SACH|nr:similar to Saccharomyces cerevisiae YDR517W GRH1 Acetylated, cis-golgi localized protein involved in ER to Golgi transport [Kazachstania saulgeensis]
MFRIAKNLVKTFEQSVQGLAQDGSQLDSFFQSIPPNLLATQLEQHEQNTMGDMGSFSNAVSGLRVVWVDELQLQLQSYFDYIVGFNDNPLPLMRNQHGYMYPDYNAIIELLNTYSNSMIKLNVWCAKGGVFRDIYIQLTPKDETEMEDVSLSNGFNGNIPSENEPNNAARLFEPLGFKVQWTSLLAATYTYHISQLNISNGPAQLAGLIPDEDYIIGCQDGLLATGGDTLLQDIVRSRAGQELVLYVYNKISDSVRPVTVNIGADGRLGCGIGSGYIHRIPAVKQQLQEQQQQQQQQQPQQQQESFPPIDPANTFTPSNINDPLLPMASTHKKKKHVAATNIMTDYFTEGKDQSPRPSSTPVDVTPPPLSAHKQ